MKNPASKVDSVGSLPTRMRDVLRLGTTAVIFSDLGEALLERRSDSGF